jgi:uncharacterized membrane protein
MLQEIAEPITKQAAAADVHSLIFEFVQRLQEGTEFLSAALIGIGIALAVYSLFRLLLTARRESRREMRLSYQDARLILSRFLAMALEFQLAADLLGTTVSPTWDQLGRLGAIALIRTFLNFFLAREIDEQEMSKREAKEAAAAP